MNKLKHIFLAVTLLFSTIAASAHNLEAGGLSAQQWSASPNGQSLDEGDDVRTFQDWTSDNQGQSNSTSSKMYTFTASAGEVLLFNWWVDSEIDCDYFVALLNGAEVLRESGDKEGLYQYVFTSSGTKTLEVRYEKDVRENDGRDCAQVYNLRLISPDWISDNQDRSNSTSSENYTFTALSGDMISFDWLVSSEAKCDYFVVVLNGAEVLRKSGEASGTYEYTFTSAGINTLEVKYTKDKSYSDGFDCAMIYNLCIPLPPGSAVIASGVCGDNLTWKLTEEYELVIEGTGAMYDFVSVEEVPWYEH